ncbi:MAG: hypothetical protein A3J10_00450 [Candidatus Sungbacteria bacterium RIFCSPLOWO2_02_FULL_54_10]|uniref:Haloacid dehalogenase n=2 Tax=Candidatus Sungiibacteriota TaxID=1817917 RepID=A0A1G2L5C1_9BACT|nr:MAG: hypothetical protein A2679_02845 [Candidatus Sungbacteria bacterium RIFCSPHIGHO2_01_FULL_54_26]OHA03414.1 MAG: hypothetical protein A3C92_01175 [Candidatus Sungbacteria bacterium RIFCSPHIGHO2_02_FULL_53_17]OHA06724.1 MAG: hypothetical protein A3B34_02535 [Candidatus Sungbacteria bacterium RIFCSPLOWO2_01_FULL_54_21]OHA12243.1 MAG: hypothetical protein A3J10_00450 [Candidatus Sungbacteria bacterium RIFCSPLOWO2_02_FULL_54_10]
MIILDFDGVLFNDARFRKDCAAVFARFGVSRRLYGRTYAQMKERYGGHRHNRHVAILRGSMPSLDISGLNRAMNALFAQSHRYLYRDALPFLSRWKKKGHALAIASNGDRFQKRKIAHSGVAPFMRKIVVGEGTKSPFIRRIAAYAGAKAKIFFIDDKSVVLEEVKKSMPRVQIIQVRRRKAQEYSTHAFAVAPTLAAADRFIR